MDSHHWHHYYVGVSQDLVGLERHRAQYGGEGVAAMLEPPR
jgi:hypothetical protein